MYGRDEHRYALRRIGDATRELEGVQEQIDSLIHDLREDNADGNALAYAIGYLFTARIRVSSALGQCDLAVSHLPTPVAREAGWVAGTVDSLAREARLRDAR